MIKLNKTIILALVLTLSNTIFAQEKVEDTNKTKAEVKPTVKKEVAKKDIAKKVIKTKKQAPTNSAEVMSLLADKFLELEKQKSKNTLSKDGKLLTPEEKAVKQANEAIEMDGLGSKRMMSKFQLTKQTPQAVAYFKINSTKYAMVDFHGKQFRVQENNWIGGFKVKNIYSNRIRFVTPDYRTISSYYMSSSQVGKKRR